MMYNYEKKYWSSGEYSLRGQSYEGYVGIRKGNGYVFDTNEPLVKNDTFSVQFNSSKNFFDRILDDDLQLPHSKKEIQYQNNDFLHKNTLRNIIINLSENNDYIFKCSSISNTSLPAARNCMLYTGNSNNVFDCSKLTSESKVSSSNYFNEIIATETCVTSVDCVDGCKRANLLLFFGFRDKIIILKHVYYPSDFDKNTEQLDFNKALVIDKVDINKNNSIKFLNIKSIKVSDNHLFVVDEKLHMVVRYDIEFLRTSWVDGEDNKKNVKVLDVVQGEGTLEDKAYFKSPCAIDVDENYIYVADAGNGCIKKYTRSFNYIKTLWNVSLGDQKFHTITVNPFQFTMSDGTRIPKNSLWVFTTTSNFIYLYVIYDNLMIFSRRLEKVKMFKHNNLGEETIISVKFSLTNSNYYYVCTNRRIFKLHLTKPFFPFATINYKKQRLISSEKTNSNSLNWGDTSTTLNWGELEQLNDKTSMEIMDNKAFSICGCDKFTKIKNTDYRWQFNGDVIFHIGGIYDLSNIDKSFQEITWSDVHSSSAKKHSGIFVYTEPQTNLSAIANTHFRVYTSDQMESIHHDEYINAQTFNKIVYKLAYNLINLKNQIIGRFVGAYNSDGIMVFDQLEYDDFFQKLTMQNIDDLFVHENEQISIIVNRIFERIYDTQEQLLNRLKAKYRAISSFTNNSIQVI